LDQPINVGFSYGKSQVTNARDAARDVYAFLQLFFTEFSQYAKSPFHLTGESYAGRYLPSISTEIIRNNKALSTEKGLIRINLESVVIGNGWVNPRIHMKNYEKFACSHDSIYQPLLDESTCEEMRYKGLHCKDLMDTCYENPSASICVPAYTYCLKIYEDPLAKTGINMYDIRKKCETDNGMCYKNIDAIRTYANLEHVRKELGIDEHIERYSECNQTVEFNFDSNGDQ
jgi:cathepsin A (carboxypeptidase C)